MGTNDPCSKLPWTPCRLSHWYNPALWPKVWEDDALNLLVDSIKTIFFSLMHFSSLLNPFSSLLNIMMNLSFALDTSFLSHVETQQGMCKLRPIKRLRRPSGWKRHPISGQGSTCQAMWIACTHINGQTEALSKLVGPERGFFYNLHKGPCELEVAMSRVIHPFPKPDFSLRVTFTLLLTYFKAEGPCSGAAPSPLAQASPLWVDLPWLLMDRCCTHIIA